MATRLGIGVMVALLVVIIAVSQSPLLRGAGSVASTSQRAAPAPAASVLASVAPSSAASVAPSAAPSTAPADSGSSFLTAYQDPQAEPAPNGLVTILSLLFKLGLVIALIYATVWVLRFLNHRTANTFTGQQSVSVLETTRLGPNREIYVVEVANKVLVLGATGTALSLLTEITDADALDGLRHRPQPSLPSAEPFLTYLKGFGEKMGNHAENAAPTGLAAAPDWEVDVAASLSAASPKKDASRRPADLLQRIEQSKQRIRQRTLAIQETGSVQTDLLDLGSHID